MDEAEEEPSIHHSGINYCEQLMVSLQGALGINKNLNKRQNLIWINVGVGRTVPPASSRPLY